MEKLGLALLIYAVLGFLITSPLMRPSSSLSRMGGAGAGSFEPLLGGVGPEGGNRVASVSAYAASKEIDSLFVQFDSMAGRLSDLYSNLELQVVERTDQLSQANEELKLQRQRVERINARLARDNRYKSDFLAIVSHEFRTPLTSILAFTEMIIDNVPESDTETLSQLEEIRKSGAILLEMVDNVLETARIQAGSERLNLELVDVSDVVGMVAAAQSVVAARKGVSLSTSVQAEVPLLVSGVRPGQRVHARPDPPACVGKRGGGRSQQHHGVREEDPREDRGRPFQAALPHNRVARGVQDRRSAPLTCTWEFYEEDAGDNAIPILTKMPVRPYNTRVRFQKPRDAGESEAPCEGVQARAGESA